MHYDDNFPIELRLQLVQRKLQEYQAEHYDRELRKMSISALPQPDERLMEQLREEQMGLEQGIEALRLELDRLRAVATQHESGGTEE